MRYEPSGEITREIKDVEKVSWFAIPHFLLFAIFYRNEIFEVKEFQYGLIVW